MQVVPSSSSSSLLSSFDDSINCCIVTMDLATTSSEVFLYWQPCLIALLSSFIFPSTFLNLLCCKKFMSVSFNEERFIGKLFSGVSSKFIGNSKGNIYCKKDYSKGEINVIKITHIRLQKMEKNVIVTSFYCLVSKIWREGKKPWFVLFLICKKTNITFSCRFVIKCS